MGVGQAEKSNFANKILNGDGEIIDKVKVKPGELPIKEYAPRNSLLTDLFEIKHIRTIYHIFLAIMVGLFLKTTAYNYLYKGKVHLGFSLIFKGFPHIHILLLTWCFLFLLSFLIFAGLKYWAIIRIHLEPKSTKLKIWDKLCLTSFMMYYPIMLYISPTALIKFDLQIAEAFALMLETVRFLMKMHAFVRSNVPRVLKYKPHTEDEILYPDFSKFLYFSLAPTLVYRDEYPRSTRINWKYVAQCFTEIIVAMFFLSFIFENFYIMVFEDYGIKPFTWQDIIIVILGNAAAGMLIKLVIFYIILHAWQNGFAEMLKFSDRIFYKDWWTSPTQERYYRTWNVIVHDWLYTYIYKDFYEIIIPKNKLAAKLMVFLISAIFHDYILGFSFRFCLPILFIQFFGVGVMVTFLKIKNNLIGNVFLWYSIALGMGINTSGYAIEYFARVNCPIENETLVSYFIPRLLSCNK